MNVTKVKTTRHYEMFNRLLIKGSVLYISDILGEQNRTYDTSKVYDSSGEYLGDIKGHYFDFADKTLFKKIE